MRCRYAEYETPGGPRVRGPGPLMAPEVRSTNSRGALRCRLLSEELQYIENLEVPSKVPLVPIPKGESPCALIDKISKLLEQGLISYKDLSSEILNILKSKRDEIVFKMKLTSKEEMDILIKRVENLEKKSEKLEKIRSQKKTIRAKKS